MIKTFSLDKIEETQLSDKKGTMIFHLTDENGNSRQVTGLTFLDANKVAKGIASVNKRELPLIQNLFEMEINETIDLEFKYFNDLYDRKSDKTVNQIACETALEMEKEEKLLYRMTHFFKKFTSSKEQVIIST